MNEIEFIERFRSDKEMFFSYGSYLRERLTYEITRSLKVKSDFFKVPISFRVKDEDSIIQKAFYRNKNYSNPYLQITDKIGGRIVVLLEEQVSEICRVIESIEDFEFSKDRDFEKERLTNPENFIYQSHHYIISNKNELGHNGIVIPVGTTCEIQVRTLLQHAYSELTHDTIYKPNTAATPEVRRYVAKSMALIEVTDSLFSKVHESLRHSTTLFAKIISELSSLYPSDIILKTDRRFNDFILDAYLEQLETFNFIELKKFVQAYKFLFEKIRERVDTKYLYQQPVILLIYWLVYTKRRIAKSKWPLEPNELETIFTDLGYAFDRAL